MNKTLTLSLIAVLAVSPLAFGQKIGKNSVNSKLEQELWKVDQQWLEAARNKKLDVLQELWTSQFFEINSGGTVPDKTEQLDRLKNREVKPDRGAFPSDFKLRAVYGNFALATDHTTLKGSFLNGHDFSGEYRVLRMFVKENGKWRVAGAAMVPIVPQ
ncbi:MAG: nuclear transport factor 2 family protein [Terriglobia bacterium]